MKFLFDLFPVILFFVAYKFGGIFVATGVAIVATFVQIGWVWFRHRKVDTMLWVSLVIVTLFGGGEANRLLDFVFGGTVHRTRRIVQHQNAGLG